MAYKKRLFYAVCLSLFFCLSLQAHLKADHYQIDISVDVESNSANEAKKRAVDEGVKKSFQTLLYRLVPVQYHPALQEKLKDPTSFLVNYSFRDEKFSPTRYRATIVHHFDRAKVHGFLQKNQIPYLDQMMPRFIVLPFLQKGDGPLQFYSEALEGFQKIEKIYPVFDFLLPLGDLEDQGMVDMYRQASSKELFEQFSSRYAVDAILIVIFKLSEEAPEGEASLEKIIVKPFGLFDLRPFIYQLTSLDLLNEISLEHHLTKIFKILMDNWFSAHLIKDLTPDLYTYKIPIQGLRSMEKLLGLLNSFPRVFRASLKEFSQKTMDVEFSYLGSADSLEQEMKKHHVSFEHLSPFLNH